MSTRRRQGVRGARERRRTERWPTCSLSSLGGSVVLTSVVNSNFSLLKPRTSDKRRPTVRRRRNKSARFSNAFSSHSVESLLVARLVLCVGNTHTNKNSKLCRAPRAISSRAPSLLRAHTLHAERIDTQSAMIASHTRCHRAGARPARMAQVCALPCVFF